MLNANLTAEVKHHPDGCGLHVDGSIHRTASRPNLQASASAASLGAAGSQVNMRPAGASRSDALLTQFSVDEVDEEADVPPTSCCAVARQLRWCGWQPHSLLYWGALMQLVGAILFIVGCFAQLPCFEPPSHEGLV